MSYQNTVDAPAATANGKTPKQRASDGGVAADRLRSFVERIERLEAEKKELADDIKEVYAEAKGIGYDTKILRKIISLRKMEEHDRREQDELLDLYMRTLGMLPSSDD